MATPMKAMFDSMNQDGPSPLIDVMFNGIIGMVNIQAIFNEEYEGGEFCRGLIFSKYASKAVWAVGHRIMDKLTNVDHETEDELPEQTMLALASKLQ